jgi:hypothetical protein
MRDSAATAAPGRPEADSPHAWRMAVAAFFTCFTLFGVVYSFGEFFKPIAAEFGANRTHTSAVFSTWF